jgi:diguanylate cyclase (GGDEF)-like protein/PAS domain S-box-containing protein
MQIEHPIDPALAARIAALRPDLDGMRLPAVILDAGQRYRYANAALLEHYGSTLEAMLGRTPSEAFNYTPPDKRREALAAALAGETVVFDRQVLLGPNAGRWVRAHYLPLHDAGRVIGVLVVSVDIQHLKDIERDLAQRERELLDQESKLRFFAENIPGPIAFVDAEFRYVFANKVFLTLRGFAAEEVVGRRVPEIFGAELSKQYFDPFVDRLRRGVTCEYERLVPSPGGESRWHLVRLVPIMGPDRRFDGYYIVGTDVHDIKAAQEKLRSAQQAVEEKERQLRQVIDAIPSPMVYCDADACYRYVNKAFLDYIGLPAERVIGRTVRELLGDERWAIFHPSLERVRAGESMAVERLVKFADGRRRWLNVRLTPRLDAEGRFLGHFATTSDIHEQKMVEEELRRANSILSAHFDNTPLGVVELDTEMRVVRWSGQAEAIFGWGAAEVLGRGIGNWRFVYEEDLDEVSKQVRRLVDGPGTQSTIVNRNYRKDGSVIWVEWHNSALRDEAGRVISLLALAQDVSSRIQAEERLQYMATHDGLTALPNRMVLGDRLQGAIARSRRSGRRAAVMFLDIDRFKDVNDTLGHRVGDAVLKELAGRLRASLRQSDLLARISGDEFVMVLEDMPDDEAPDRIASKVLDEARRPFAVEGHEVHVSASLGVALFPEDGDDAETLLKNADAAMYAAKELGRNNFRLYSSELAARRARRLEVEAALGRALKAGELELHFQPILDLASGTVTRAEALLRWDDPAHGFGLPTPYIPTSEESGLAHDLGLWVMESACRHARAWRDAGLGDVAVCVNLSPNQLRDSTLIPMLKRTLAKTGCEPGWLQFEIAETSMVRDIEGVSLTLGKLRKLGVRVAVDDFGTGFSSLAHLRQLPVDALKIDRSFVADIDATATGRARPGSGGAAIVSAVIGLARGLGLEITATGIEKKAQLAFLTRAGCTSGQGYLLCPPLPAPEFEQWLRGRKKKTKK